MSTRTFWLFLSLVLLHALHPVRAHADNTHWDISANIDLQTRYFTQDARWAGQDDSDGALSVAVSPEFRWRNAAGTQRASILPFLRWDNVDDQRSLADLREAYWAYEGDDFEVLVGANTVFWGVTESVHLVDIINQTDAVADIDGEDKLGQPMINLEVQRDWGLLGLYLMPYFRERTFAGTDGRFRPPIPVDEDNARFESGAKQQHLDIAVRYSHYLGDVDIGASVFSGTSREPRLVPSGNGTLLPYYDQIEQVGLDLQYTRDAWLWKLEAIGRGTASDNFFAAVGGLEYTLYQVFDSNADLGLLVEYQFDDRAATEPLTLADDDVFVAARFALNDMQDTTALVGLAYDLATSATFLNVEAERRLGTSYVLELRARFFSGDGLDDPVFIVANDDYLQLQLSRYF